MTQHYFSPSTLGFYVAGVHTDIPTDAVEITVEEHAGLMEAQAEGKIVTYENDSFVLADFVPPPVTWETIRSRRDSYLSDCDWTQLLDNQLSESEREEWRVYRQLLRDVTETFENPEEVVWPDSPDMVDQTPPEA